MDRITIVVDPIQIVGLVLVILCVGIVIGAASGYFTASKDLDEERAKARRAGFDAGVETAWSALPVKARDVVRSELHALELRADEDQTPAAPWGAGR